jgi:hypothetical protein
MANGFSYDVNCLSYWQPRLEQAGVLVPRTTIIRAATDLTVLLDGLAPEGWAEFHALVQAACYDHGLPCFLRTGQGSGKHDWCATCFVTDAENISRHIGALVEWSHLVGIVGLPHDVWAVRDLIQTKPLFTCHRYNNFPVTREFRVFVENGEVTHLQPYWPPGAVDEGEPDEEDWKEKLAAISELEHDDEWQVRELAERAWSAMEGQDWSVDLLQDVHGRWWVIDMALAERSFRWDPSEAVG